MICLTVAGMLVKLTSVPDAVDTGVPNVKPPLTVDVTVTAPVAPLTDIPVPATMLVTPEFVTVTAPVAPLTEIPVPATFDVTPAFVRVTELPKATAPPPDIPVPAVTVTEELVKAELATLDKVPPNVKLPDVVTVPDRDKPLTVPVPLTLVTDPVPAAAQEPSPRQNVLADADVPEFKLVTGRFPVTPELKGRPVADVKTKVVGVPRLGVTKVGEVAKTAEPVPVSSVKAAARFADDGVPRKVATPLPKDVIPVPPEATGRAEPSVKEEKYEAASTTFVPLL